MPAGDIQRFVVFGDGNPRWSEQPNFRLETTRELGLKACVYWIRG